MLNIIETFVSINSKVFVIITFFNILKEYFVKISVRTTAAAHQEIIPHCYHQVSKSIALAAVVVAIVVEWAEKAHMLCSTAIKSPIQTAFQCIQ